MPVPTLGHALSALGIGRETLAEPLRLKPFEHWVGHIPFAFWLVSALRPRCLVEIGTHRGNSFLAFCQAIESEGCGTRAYAVDTWEGDEHMAFERGLFEELSAYHDPRYGHFSSLIRSTFDEARGLFSDGSIDLLHIDGTHVYEAVKHDFETWRPALSDRAVVLFHDTNVRRDNYGVWKLWEELAREHRHFTFFHSYGLGVLGVGENLPEPLRALFAATAEEELAQQIRAYFSARGAVGVERLAKEVGRERHAEALGEVSAQFAQQQQAAQAEIARQQQSVAAVQAECARRDEAIAAARGEAAALQGEVAALHAQSATLRAEISALDAEKEAVQARAARLRRTENEQFLQRSADSNARLLAAEDRLGSAETRMQEVLGELDATRALVSLHESDLRTFRASTFWRLTSPLRTVAELIPLATRVSRRRRVRRVAGPPEAPACPVPALPGGALQAITDGGLAVAEPPLPATPVIALPPAADTAGPEGSEATAHWPITLPDLFALREFEPTSRIAVVIHIFYPELSDELLDATDRLSERFDLFVTLVEGHSDHLQDEIRTRFPAAGVWVFPNRGRDVLPFMALAATGVLSRYALVCKLHTKRSPHRVDGDAWRQHLVSSILPDRDGTATLIGAFDADPDLGIAFADGQIFQGNEFWGGNLQHLRNLLPLLGSTLERATLLPFAGGSIFWIRASLLRDLVGLKLEPEAFEPEPIGLDGTLAHAVERLFSIVCHAAGMRLEQSSVVAAGHAQRSAPATTEPRVVAFYLPQFHPIPENDRWWGRGFTEWTNVTRAQPLFPGHRQPRLPGELGFTDLRLPETRAAQAELARAYGISAFCYYYYWFGTGRRLLHRPLDEVLASGEPDFPFLICWANEPWARNWDGANSEVLIPQEYPEGWAEAFARDVAPVLRDPRYLRLRGDGNRPMLMIYRIMQIPRPAEAVAQLRATLRELGVGEVHIAAGRVSLQGDAPLPDFPASIGLDSYFEFPPHDCPVIPAPPEDKPAHMTGGLHDYALTVDAALARLATGAAEPSRHHSVMMGWDNTARRGAAAHAFRGATPSHFRRWLRGVVRHEQARPAVGGERLVFVNAWNEWAEGTCLEPDRDFGRGWLEAVRSALGRGLEKSR